MAASAAVADGAFERDTEATPRRADGLLAVHGVQS